MPSGVIQPPSQNEFLRALPVKYRRELTGLTDDLPTEAHPRPSARLSCWHRGDLRGAAHVLAVLGLGTSGPYGPGSAWIVSCRVEAQIRACRDRPMGPCRAGPAR